MIFNELSVPSPKKHTENKRRKPNEKNDTNNIDLLKQTAFIPRFTCGRASESMISGTGARGSRAMA